GIGKKRAAELLAEFPDLEAVLAAAIGRDKPKFWAALAEHADAARKSLELATVCCDVSIEASWEKLAWEYKPTPGLRELLTRLEFRQLVQELGGTPVEERDTDYATIH